MEGSAPREPGHMTLLEVQSEQLAIKLQREADQADNNSSGSDTIVDSPPRSEASTAEQSRTAQAATSQGVWGGTPGKSTADILRQINNPSPPGSDRTRSGRTNASSPPPAGVLTAVPLSPGAVGALVGMGIEEASAAAALRRCGGSDVSRAVEFCFSHDMEALAKEDEALHAAAPQANVDSDMAFAMALEQEERSAFEARRTTAAAGLAAEEGTFGSKIKFASGIAPPPAERSQEQTRRWGVADAEALMEGEEESSLGDERYAEDGEADGLAGEDGGDGYRAVPGGGRRKGKMPLFKNSAGEVVSKHDAVICGRMNAQDASNFEGVGDLTAAGVRLSNRTFNSLKRDIRKKKEKGMSAGERVEGATRSTQEGVMDPRTRLLVFKMVNAGTLLEVHGMVKTGKEAHVYHALAPEDAENLTGIRGVALKIFKTTLNEFGNRAAYVDGDPRYGHIKFNKQSRRKMFTIWAKKEHRNLLRLHRRGVPCPEPIMQREHTLVMSFVGKDHWPAPQLRELDLSPSNWRRCYAQVVELARLMFMRCRLVHADLSEYNVLYHEKVCYVIDVGQAVDTGHPKARELLSRDLSVVTEYFRRQGVDGCLDTSVVEQFVVGYPGPSHHVEVGSAEVAVAAVAAGRGAGDEEPLTGVQVITQLMETPADEAEDVLRSLREAAEPWATRMSTRGGGDDFHERFDSNDDESEDDEEEGEEEGSESGDGVGGNDDIGQGWTVVDADGVPEAAKENKARAEKVELGERERARTADQKEALKAGIF